MAHDAEPPSNVHEPLDLGPLLRALRHAADLSQRELATLAGMRPATVAEIESGANGNPRVRTLERLVVAAGGRIRILGAHGAEVQAGPHDHLRDEGGRHFPGHLDVRPVRTPRDWSGAWWAPWYTLREEQYPKRVPPWTYDGRDMRDRRRAREQEDDG
jgi:transcriptional regulator with XRE-family HTH domain